MAGAVISAHGPFSPRQRGHLEALGLRLWQPWGLGSSYSRSPWEQGFDASEPASLHVAVHSLELGTLRNMTRDCIQLLSDSSLTPQGEARASGASYQSPPDWRCPWGESHSSMPERHLGVVKCYTVPLSSEGPKAPRLGQAGTSLPCQWHLGACVASEGLTWAWPGFGELGARCLH